MSCVRPKRSLEALLAPRSVAVVGASRNSAAFGNLAIANLQRYGFSGAIYPVHPTETEINGLPSWRGMGELPETPDLCIVTVRAELAPGVIRECAERGVPAVTLVGSGFAESGQEEGIARQEEIIRVATDAGMLVLGPNTLGAAGFTGGAVSLASANVPADLKTGGVGIVSQSGGLGTTILATAERYGLGIASFVAVGNEAGIATPDVISYFVEQQASAILCYIEAIRDVPAFKASALRAHKAGIPVVVLKGGTQPSGQAVTAAHTASLAGSTRVFEVAISEWGVKQVSSMEALVASGVLFERCGPAPGDRCGVMGLGGGISALLADAAEANGLKLASLQDKTASAIREILPDSNASNPLDPGGWFLGQGGAERLKEALDRFAEDEAVDLLLYGIVPLSPMRESVYIEGIAAGAAHAAKPSVCLSFHTPMTEFRRRRFEESNVVELPCVDAGMEALRTWLSVVSLVDTEEEPSGALEESHVARVIELIGSLVPGERQTFLEDAAIGLLTDIGIPLPNIEVVQTPEEVGKRSEAMGFPVVVKALAEGLVHRAQVGAVALGVGDRAQAEAAASRVLTNAQAAIPGKEVRLLVQRQVESGTEMLVGVQNDPVFGVVIVVGLGGVWSEVLDDVAFVFPPVTPRRVGHALRQLRSARYLERMAETGTFDQESFVDIVVQVGRAAEALGPVLEAVDLNPVIVGPEGAAIVDALVILQGSAGVKE